MREKATDISILPEEKRERRARVFVKGSARACCFFLSPLSLPYHVLSFVHFLHPSCSLLLDPQFFFLVSKKVFVEVCFCFVYSAMAVVGKKKTKRGAFLFFNK